MKIFREENIERLKEIVGSRSEVFVIMDDSLEGYSQYFEEYYNFLNSFNTLSIKTIETNKNLRTIEEIYEWLFANNVSRNSLLIGFGGGIISDITGFVAATYNRGIECGLIPTTLLSQCDASLGGKNGCNFNGYKNLIGTIREPSWIFVSSLFLRSLPERVKNEGIAEMLKTFLISDSKSYNQAIEFFKETKEKNFENYTPEEFERLNILIEKCQQIKLKIVKKDFTERGERRLLNFGHTFGHALEKILSGILHGEAVSVGMAMAIDFSETKGICTKEEGEKIKEDLRTIALPTTLKELQHLVNDKDTSAIISDVIIKDKKREGEYINFIYLKERGRAVVKPTSLREINDFLITSVNS